MVTKRDSGRWSVFAASFGRSVAAVATTAPLVTGPGLSPLSAFSSTRPALSWLLSGWPQRRALVWMGGTAARPVDAGRIGVIDRASGNAVMTLKRSVIGCE